jgi:hypothetical protein
MGLLPARMQIADEGMTLGAKVERKAMPTVAEKQKYAHSAFEMNDHQPDGTVKPTMLVSFSQVLVSFSQMVEAAELESQIWRGMVAAAAMSPPKPLYNPIDFTFDLGDPNSSDEYARVYWKGAAPR